MECSGKRHPTGKFAGNNWNNIREQNSHEQAHIVVSRLSSGDLVAPGIRQALHGTLMANGDLQEPVDLSFKIGKGNGNRPTNVIWRFVGGIDALLRVSTVSVTSVGHCSSVSYRGTYFVWNVGCGSRLELVRVRGNGGSDGSLPVDVGALT